MVEKKGKGFSAILQAFDVGDESAPFNGEDKLFRCPFIPAFKDLFLREAIKGHIQFYRAKIFGIKFKPLFLGEVRRIKDSIPPMGIVIAACSDEDHNQKGFEPACPALGRDRGRQAGVRGAVGSKVFLSRF